MFEKVGRWLRFNLRYLGKPPWDTGVSPPELINYLKTADPGRALDLGCGTGTNLKTMAEYGWEVVGVDLAWLSILRARLKLRQAGVEGYFKTGEVTGDLNFDKPFDFVLDIGCYHGLSRKEKSKYRQNLQNWLKPGGTFLIYTHRRTSPDDSHGVLQEDLDAFEVFLNLQWRENSDESRPDGSGGRTATWSQFMDRRE